MRDYLFNTEKINYVTGNKPQVACILCAIRDNHPAITNLEITRTSNFILSVNLYPFNPGHVMIFPKKHIENLEELSESLAIELHQLLVKTISVLKEEFNPSGFNIGWNLGQSSGASITHIHQHIVPRYQNEVGFLDVLAGTRIMVSDPVLVMERLKGRFS